MKIAHILDTGAYQGGVATHVKSTIALLQEQGHEVISIGLNRKKNSTVSWQDRYFPQTYGPFSGFTKQRQLKKLLTELKPDLIHIHSGFTTISPLLVRYMRHFRHTIGTIHDVRPFCHWSTRRYIPDGSICGFRCSARCVIKGCYIPKTTKERAKLVNTLLFGEWALHEWRRLDHLIVPSTYIKELAIQHGFSPAKIALIPHFTKANGIKPQITANNEPVILYIGRLEYDKGITHFIDALAQLKHLRWKAHVLGEGSARAAVQARVAASDLAERVVFYGDTDEHGKHQQLQNAFMLVFPSLIPESFGMSGIEAFAAATPVVSFGLGGVSEWLRDGENGLIARDSDANDLAWKMKQLLMDPELARQLGQTGYLDVTKKFDASNNIKLLNSVYQKFQPVEAMA